MPKDKSKQKLIRRKRRVRAKVFGTNARPRLSVYRSLRHLEVQLIDDQRRITLFSLNSRKLRKGFANREIARELGKLLAERASKAGIKAVVFDRGGRKYHGQIQALADGAREGGLKL